MKWQSNPTVYVVDSDADVREALAWSLRSQRLFDWYFDSTEAFDAYIRPKFPLTSPACVLLDTQMDGLRGLKLLDKIIAYGALPALPVIFLSGHSDVALAVDAVKRGAFDFREKPFIGSAMIDCIAQALSQSASALPEHKRTNILNARFFQLTLLEREVIKLIVEGFSNWQTAALLQVSVRMVETHRAQALKKMGVRTAVELIKVMPTPPRLIPDHSGYRRGPLD